MEVVGVSCGVEGGVYERWVGGSVSGWQWEIGTGKTLWKGGAVVELALVSFGRESCQSVRPPSHDWDSAETLGEVNKDEWTQSRISHFSPQVSDAAPRSCWGLMN